MSITSLTNKLARKKKYARYKATREEESRREVRGPEKSLGHILTSTLATSVGKSSVASHLESPLTRKTTSLFSGHPEKEFLVNPIQEP